MQSSPNCDHQERPTSPRVGVEKSRRSVLLAGTGAAAILVLPAPLAAEDGSLTEETQEAKRRGCTLGFSTYGMKTVPTERAIKTLKDIGFDAVELAVRTGWDTDSTRLTANRRRSLRTLLDDSGLRLTSLMEHVYPIDEQQQVVALERLKMAAGVAHDLAPAAPPHVQTVLGGGVFEQKKNLLRDRLGAWLEIANATNTTIAIKPHRGGVVSQPAEAVWLLQQLGNPGRLRMVYDYSHYAFRDLPMVETIRTALPYTVYIAVKDAVNQDGRIMFQLPGQAGTIDFVKMIEQFEKGGYRGDINCEVSSMVSGKNGYDPIAAAKTCYTNMTHAFRAAGVMRPAHS